MVNFKLNDTNLVKYPEQSLQILAVNMFAEREKIIQNNQETKVVALVQNKEQIVTLVNVNKTRFKYRLNGTEYSAPLSMLVSLKTTCN